MARPRKVGLDYFPHDSNASHDTKILALELEHGLSGYAFYFKMLEFLYSEGAINLKLPATKGACIKSIGVSRKKFDDMLDTCFVCGLFDREMFDLSGFLTSTSIQKRIKFATSRRVYDEETQQKQGNNDEICVVNDEFLQQKPCNNQEETTQSAELPLRAKENKITKEKDITPNNKKTLPAASLSDELHLIVDNWTDDEDLRSETKAWIAERKNREQKPPTPHAIDLALRKLDKLASTKDEKLVILQEATIRGWRGLFSVNDSSTQQRDGNKQPEKPKDYSSSWGGYGGSL